MALLDIDAGELEDEPEELYALADLVHVACGGHAGDDASMTRVVRACKRLGTRVGAHPSYVDREGFGRRALDVAPDVLASQIAEQCGRLYAVAAREGVAVVSMKPHGALYHRANADIAIARACIEGAARDHGPVAVVAPPGGALEAAAVERRVPLLVEGFADRGARPDGSLIPRGEPGAMIEDPEAAGARARALATRGGVDLICIHGDTAGALAIARAVRAALGPRQP